MKKTVNRFFAAVLAALMLLSLAPFAAFAEDAYQGGCGENLTWTLDETGVLTITGTGAMTDYTSTSSPFCGRTDIVGVVLENGVTRIGDYAFSGCTALESVSIPDGAESIGYMAFKGCGSLTGVTIPGSVADIGSGAFYRCAGLDGLTIENGVETVGTYAFFQCGSLSGVTLPDSVTEIGSNAFNGCSSLSLLSFGSGVESIGDEAFEDCAQLTQVVLPASVQTVGDMAFFNCANLSGVTVPDSVAVIGSSAFANTAYYADAGNWDSGVLYVGAHLLEVNKSALPSFCTIRAGTKTLAEEAFYGCTGLKNLTIEEGLSEISASAFYGCSGLKRVRIPVSVTSIARKAFYNCGSLTDVYYFGSEEQWNAVSIESTNHTVTDAAKHFNAAPEEHVWDDGTVTTAPTCTDEGVLTIACVFCDARRTEPVEATGHSYGAWVKYNGTYHKRVCANDETHYEVEKHKWNAGKITKAATCTVAGVKTYTCTVCGQTKKVSVAATGHDWGAWTNYDAAQHHRVCGNDASHIEYEDHAWNAGVITKKPTCTAKGVRTYTCTVCGAKKTASVKAKGHKYGEWQKLDDTLHQKICANDASHVITEEHTWDEGVVTKEPTTASLGVRTFNCAVCGGTKTESIPKLLAKLAPTAANTATGIKLTWKKDPNAKGYYVFRKTGTGSYVTLKKITSNATVTYEDTTVADGVAYTYGVRSYRGTEKGDYTAKKITRLAPITPTAENVVGGVKLTWPKVAGATGYYVFRKTGSGSYKTLETIKSAETVSYTDTTAQSGVVYTYGVRAYKSTTKGAYTPQSICCLGAVSPTLTNLAGGVSVKWTQIAGATGYEIYRKTGSGSLTLIKTINAGETVSFTDTAVKSSNGTVYTYAVKAFNASTAASYTEKKIDRVLTVAFTSLTNPLNGAMNVKWKQNEAASGYQIQYATNSDFSGAKTVTVKYSESVSKTIQGLTKGNTYYVRLRVYATVDEVNYYSTWNTAKTVQIVK